MSHFRFRAPLLFIIAFLLVLQLVGASFISRQTADAALDLSVAPGNEHFERTWARMDKPIADGQVSRTWTWSPDANTDVLQEPYLESPGGMRDVQYFDKSRMELTHPDGDPDSIWYVTNGLLVVEMIDGQLQVGDNSFEPREPAEVPVAGDPDDADGPTYKTFGPLTDAEPLDVGIPVTQIVDRAGNVTTNAALEVMGVMTGFHDDVTNHTVAAPFWDFMNSSGTVYEDGQFITDTLFENPVFATGRPITEAYWADVKVGGTVQLVLMQCFERRCLTFTPGNEPNWQVETGNVGLHYRAWRTSGPMPPPGKPGDAVINEIMYEPEFANFPAWVELYNPGDQPIDFGPWVMTNGDGSKIINLAGWTLPGGAYLVVYFGDGVNDTDFSDGSGSYYAGESSASFFTRSDVALYKGPPNSDTIEDFFAWGYQGEHPPGAAYEHAVEAGIWNAGDFYDTYGGIDFASVTSQQRVHSMVAGESLGRDRAGTDTNLASDWGYLGGPDALDATPGAMNFSALVDEFFSVAEEESSPALAGVTIPQPAKPWTIMVYNDGRDRNLERDLLGEINEMIGVGSDTNVNIVIEMTSSLNFSRRGYVESTGVAWLGADFAPNPGNPNKLSNFIAWAQANFPASRYAIVFGGHGGGWKGLFPVGPAGDFLTMSELSAGLSSLGQPFDVVKFDACLMANVEVARQISPQANFMVASEQISWGGFPWAEFINELQGTPGMNGGQVADRLTQLHVTKIEEDIFLMGDNYPYSEKRRAFWGNYTWSSIDTGKVTTNLTPAVSTFAGTLIDDVDDINIFDFLDDNSQLIIKHEGREKVKEYHDTNYIDLYRFAELISMTLLKAADDAPPVINGVADAVRWESHGPTAAHENSHGLSIYFPRTLLLPNNAGSPPSDLCGKDTSLCGSSKSYDDPLYDPTVAIPTAGTHLYRLDASIRIPSLAGAPHAMIHDPAFLFPAGTLWDEFLYRYYKPVADACARVGDNCVDEAFLLVGQVVTLSGEGSSDSDGLEGPLNDVPAHVGGPLHYYWDFDTSADNPNPIPVYQPGVQYVTCDDAVDMSEDCDRDEVDDIDDDADAIGKTVQFPCVVPGDFPVRLMVWDEHHDQVRQANEMTIHNNGRHWLHFNVHDDWVTIHCGVETEPTPPPTIPALTPKKESSPDSVAPGETITYELTIPAAGDTENPVTGSMVDELVQLDRYNYNPSSLECSAGACGYDEELKTVNWEGTIPSDTDLTISFSVTLLSELPLTAEFVQNCALFTVGETESTSCTTTQIQLTPSTDTSSGFYAGLIVLGIGVAGSTGMVVRRRRQN